MRQFRTKKFLFPAVTLVFTLMLTCYLVYFAYQAQQSHSMDLVDKLAEQQSENLQQVIESDLHFIGAGANFFRSTHPDDWDRFSIFAEQVLSSSQSLIALQWMQRVESKDIDTHIAKVRATFPFYEIYTIPKDGPKTFGYILPNNQPIYTASDVYPRSEANFKALGYYSSRSRFQLVLDHIVKTGQPSLSDKVRLLQDGIDKSISKTGLLVYHPVFSVDQPQKLIGVVIGAIRSTKYFESIVLRTATEQELLVRVTDLGFDAEDDPILYQSDGWQESQGIDIQKRIRLPNREWVVDFKLAGTVPYNDKMVLWSIGLTGLTVSLLLTYIVYLLLRDQEYLEKLLNERTRELQFLVDYDALTGIYNRRAFSRHLQQRVTDNQCFSLIGFDIDEFKQINDSYGHIAGDEVLIGVANVVLGQLREGDIFVRIGGDEFCIISNVTEPQALADYVQQICDAVGQAAYHFAQHDIRCTLSIGAAIRTDESQEDILQHCDAELYKSKQAGRNCVSIAA